MTSLYQKRGMIDVAICPIAEENGDVLVEYYRLPYKTNKLIYLDSEWIKKPKDWPNSWTIVGDIHDNSNQYE